MITLFSGTPGSGKSLHAAALTYNWLIYEHKNVIANFPVNRDILMYSQSELKKVKRKKAKGIDYKPKKRGNNPGKFFCFSDEYMTVENLLKYAKKFNVKNKEGQTLLIIDECCSDDFFNNRTWQNKSRNSWVTFFRQHRKLGFEIILISQSDKLLDRAMRAFIEYEVKHRKANNFKLLGRFLGFCSGGALFFAVKYWYGVREKVDVQTFNYKTIWGDFYDTYKVF